MNQESWIRIEKVRNYLESRKELGIKRFAELLEKVKIDEIKTVVITFTYENLEVLEKVENKFALNADLVGIINRYEIEELSNYDYDDEDEFEDFKFTQLNMFSSELIKYWIAECFHQAQEENKINTQFYFKEMHDQMEVLELNKLQILYEKTEFESFVRNNQFQLLQE